MGKKGQHFQNRVKLRGNERMSCEESAILFANLAYRQFPTGWDSTTFWDNRTEVSLLSQDKGTTGQAQNLATGQDGPGQLVKIRDGTWDGTGF